jgi:hypothetical protein
VTAAGVTLPPEKQSAEADTRRRLRGAVAMGAVVAFAWVRRLGRRRRSRRELRTRHLAMGEVIVVHPAQSWRDERRDRAISAMFALVERRMRAWDVTVRARRSIERKHLPGLGRTYVRLGVVAGGEDDLVRAINVAAWRYALPLGRRGVLAVRSPLIVPAADDVDPPGSIVFTEAYARAKAIIGVDGESAEGVKVLVVDWEPPVEEHLPADANITVLDPSDRTVVDGHATAITAVIADIAKGAAITSLSIGDEDPSEGFWAFLDVVKDEQDADVIVASMSASEGGRSKDDRGRENLFESIFRDRLGLARHPPVFCPTGNHSGARGEPDIDTIAIPARFASVVAIGACDENGRSGGSRYGPKVGGEPSVWWLAPGGSFGALVTPAPLLEMGGRAIVGTSVANAVAGGLAACVIKRMRELPNRRNAEFEAAIAAMRRSLSAFPDAAQSLVQLDAIEETHSGGAITLGRLLGQFKTMSRPERLPRYNPLEHGSGLLSLERAADDAGGALAPSPSLQAQP